MEPEAANNSNPVNRSTYIGLFLIALATLLYEILLTRIFSVTMWYHFAFMAISVAMFGMTSGALMVYLKPEEFTKEKTPGKISYYSLLFAISTLLAIAGHALVQIIVEPLPQRIAWSSFAILTYPLMAIPFFLSGVAITLALTRFPKEVGRLYACDLSGAAIACLLIAPILSITDGLTAVIISGAIAAAGAYCFGIAAKEAKLTKLSLASFIVLVLLSIAHTAMSESGNPFLRLRLVKGQVVEKPIYEKWNSFSRINVSGDPNKLQAPFGWGLSRLYPKDRGVRQLLLQIDGTAGTTFTHFDKLSEMEHLRWDVTNIAHYIRPDSNVLVVGVGGGRDLLSALSFKQKSVTGVEINGDIIKAVTGRFGDFSGHIDRMPGVKIVNDEARSYIARSPDKYEIIQVSLIDTWAATAAGGLALTENSLYTLQSWKSFMEHLSDRGVLSFSRWYPGEVYRMTSLARAALIAEGVKNTREHIIIVKSKWKPEDQMPAAVATMIVGKQPFTKDDLENLKAACDKLGFEIILSPNISEDQILTDLSTEDPSKVMDLLGVNMAPPTDDCPYFFQMVPLSNFWKGGLNVVVKDSPITTVSSNLSVHSNAILMLFGLLMVVLLFTVFCIFRPLLKSGSKITKSAWPLLSFFLSIGMGFMIIEMSQMQRLSVFLGHPTYSLTVLLFSLLLSGGMGSLSTGKILSANPKLDAQIRLIGLVLTVALTGLVTPQTAAAFQSAETPVRIVVAAALTIPMGFFMGMAFPLGLKLASKSHQDLTPWFWGMNGAASVCASVVAVLLALAFGIQASFFTGAAFYAIALLSFFAALKNESTVIAHELES